MLDNDTQAVLNHELTAGARVMTLSEMKAGLAKFGYELNRSMDCRSMARIMTGPLAGTSYKACSIRIRERDTKLGACNYQARRDASFEAMREFSRFAYVILPGGWIADFS